MNIKDKFNPVRGMHDYLPRQNHKRNRLLTIITEHFVKAGFLSVSTPAVEELAWLTFNDYGQENSKLIFKVIKSEHNYGLRFDLTMPLMRLLGSNHHQLPLPAKLMQIGQVWRAERPQRGRLRQFMQCDIDIIGVESLQAEYELIQLSMGVLQQLGIKDLTVLINSKHILTEVKRTLQLSDEQFKQFCITVDKVDKIGKEEVMKELSFIAQKELLIEFIYESSSFCYKYVNPQLMQGIKELIELCPNAIFNPLLVRGMGYYTGTIFEIKTATQSYSLAGGGRYDKLPQIVSNNLISSACGISLGFERLVDLIELQDASRRLVILYPEDLSLKQFKEMQTYTRQHLQPTTQPQVQQTCVYPQVSGSKTTFEYGNSGTHFLEAVSDVTHNETLNHTHLEFSSILFIPANSNRKKQLESYNKLFTHFAIYTANQSLYIKELGDLAQETSPY